MRYEVEHADDGGQWAMAIGGGNGGIWLIYLLPQQSLCEPSPTILPFRKIQIGQPVPFEPLNMQDPT